MVLKRGFDGDLGVGNILMDAYANCGELSMSKKVFDGMTLKDVVSRNSIIGIYAQSRFSTEALEVFHSMVENGDFSYNAVTLSSLMLARVHSGTLRIGNCNHFLKLSPILFKRLGVDSEFFYFSEQSR